MRERWEQKGASGHPAASSSLGFVPPLLKVVVFVLAALGRALPAGQGRRSCPPLPAVLEPCVRFCPPGHRHTQQRATKGMKGLELLSHEERLRGLGLLSQGKRRFGGDLINI